MCDISGCSSEVGSDCAPDAMLDILQEFQGLYRQRMARLEQDPTAPTFSQEKMQLLEDWIGDLHQQNHTLVDTVRELESEASRRCEMLEGRLVSTTSSTKQYMQQLHLLQQQVQQLVAGRLQAESRTTQLTSLVNQLTADNDRLRLQSCTNCQQGQHCGVRETSQGDGSEECSQRPTEEARDDVTRHVLRLKADLRVALREKQDIEEILEIRNCELEENRQETASLRADLEREKTALAASAARAKHGPPAEVHRLWKHCRGLVDQRNQALAELATVKVHLMEVLQGQVDGDQEAAGSCQEEAQEEAPEEVLEEVQEEVQEAASANLGLTNAYLQPSVTPPQSQPATGREHAVFLPQACSRDEMEQRLQLVAALRGHLASARNEVTLKDETLGRLEVKLESVRRQLATAEERLLQVDGERAALLVQNRLLDDQVSKLRSSMDESTSVRQRLEGEVDSQLAQITELQERLLVAENSNVDLTGKCVEKDVEIGRQWTTISSLRQALLESKRQAEAAQARPSLLGGLLGGAVRRDVHNI